MATDKTWLRNRAEVLLLSTPAVKRVQVYTQQMFQNYPEQSHIFNISQKFKSFFVISRKMKVLNITTSDGGNFKVDWDVARQSQTIRTMLDDLSIDEDSNNEDTIPLANEEVTGTVFEKSLIWMEHNRGKPDFQEETDDDELKPKEFVSWSQLDEWQKKYINIPVSEMFPLLIVGNFLEIKGLVNLMVKGIALQIQGKTSAEEIRKMFNIEDPKWTPEELQKLKDEHAWAYEAKK